MSTGRIGTMSTWANLGRVRYRPSLGVECGPLDDLLAVAHKVIDFGEGFIALEELFAHALDNTSNVCPITVFATADEAFVVYPIVDRPNRWANAAG
jgi:hypothetical protein